MIRSPWQFDGSYVGAPESGKQTIARGRQQNRFAANQKACESKG
jgi:hypothetical protein